MAIYFSEVFEVEPAALDTHCAAIHLSTHGNAPEITPVLTELEELNSLHRRAAHRASYDSGEVRLNRDDVKKAQRLAYELIERLSSPAQDSDSAAPFVIPARVSGAREESRTGVPPRRKDRDSSRGSHARE
jgi:hypothetical protein